jgi:hypothetical protein
MDWLTQNLVWILLAIGAVWLFGRGRLAGFGMRGHGTEETWPVRSEGDAAGSQVPPAEAGAEKGAEPARKGRHRGCC